MKPIQVKDIVKAVNGALLCGKEETTITSVTTNSKEIVTGALFVPIIGERVDAHQFIDMAFAQGAAAVFTSRQEEAKALDSGKVYIQVEDTIKALQALGAYYRTLFSIPLIGITGSVGKTTTKEMISAALETKKNVLKTIGNRNSQIGLPLMMFHIEEQHEIAVIEMGMSEEGEMSRLTQIAKPDMAVVTNIGVSHIGQLGSKENIRKEKLNIINAFVEKKGKNNLLFLNGNDELLLEIEALSQSGEYRGCANLSEATQKGLQVAEIMTFGTDERCLYHAKNIKTVGTQTHFTLVYPRGTEDVVLSVLGIHNVNNALVAFAIAEQFGIEPMVAKEGLKNYKPIAMRGQIYEKDGIQIIDDTYNASPDSMKSSVHVLVELENLKRRFVVFADVLELGEVSRACHYEVGSYITQIASETKKIDEVITVGEQAKAIAEAIIDAKSNMVTHSFSKNEEVISYLKNTIKAGDGIIVKGSRGMHTEDIVNAFR